MNKRLSIGVVLFLSVLLTGLSVQAQQPLDEAAARARVEEALFASEEAADRANEAVDRAFDLLGLFEAIGFFVTILAGAAGLFGFTRLGQAREALDESRENIEHEVAEIRQRFEEVLAERESELAELRKHLESAAMRDRQATSNALLANALMPIGERQYRAQDYEGALNTYQRALELDPESPVVHQRIAYVYTHNGALDNARKHYEMAIKRERDFAPALAGLGFVYRRLGENMDEGIDRDLMYNQAEKYLLEAMRLSPRLVDDDGESWWGVLGGLYKRREEIDRAIGAYEKATVVTPESSYGFGNLAYLYMRKGNYDDMLKMYEKMERIAAREAVAEQGNYWGYADLIVSRYALGKSEQAKADLPALLAIAPPNSPYMLDALISTLEQLTEVLTEDKVPAIQEATTEVRAFRELQKSDATIKLKKVTL
ncbi:MAG: tetratricopeptide repeat protein [Aggregatilineales bacterium]